jgi:hypothetical protein
MNTEKIAVQSMFHIKSNCVREMEVDFGFGISFFSFK